MSNQNKRLTDLEYDRIKIIYKLSKLLHFVEHHAQEDAKKTGDVHCIKLLEDLENDLKKNIGALHSSTCKK